MSSEDRKETEQEMKSLTIQEVLAFLTGTKTEEWLEYEGVDTHVGLDYYFETDRYHACINLDQTTVVYRVYEKESGDRIVALESDDAERYGFRLFCVGGDGHARDEEEGDGERTQSHKVTIEIHYASVEGQTDTLGTVVVPDGMTGDDIEKLFREWRDVASGKTADPDDGEEKACRWREPDTDFEFLKWLVEKHGFRHAEGVGETLTLAW